MLRKAAYVMMGFDHCGLSKSGLNHIGVNGSLNQIVHCSDLFGFFLKYADKFLANDLALCLRLLHAL